MVKKAMDFALKRRIEGEYVRRLTGIFNLINKAIVGLTVTEASVKVLEIIDSPAYTRAVESAVMNMITMFEVPVPVKFVLAKGYEFFQGHLLTDYKYSEFLGALIPDGYDEFEP